MLCHDVIELDRLTFGSEEMHIAVRRVLLPLLLNDGLLLARLYICDAFPSLLGFYALLLVSKVDHALLILNLHLLEDFKLSLAQEIHECCSVVELLALHLLIDHFQRHNVIVRFFSLVLLFQCLVKRHLDQVILNALFDFLLSRDPLAKLPTVMHRRRKRAGRIL